MVEPRVGAGERRLPSIIALLIALSVPLIAGAVGGFVTQAAIPTWYQQLRKPAWNPPTWIFAPVWTVLYLLMGIASWLVWQRGVEAGRGQSVEDVQRQRLVQGALTLYGIHLLFNAAWSLIFFGLRRIDLALVEIVGLWGLLFASLLRFYRIRPLAGLLLVPYQLWTSFAALLNATIWWLNRGG